MSMLTSNYPSMQDNMSMLLPSGDRPNGESLHAPENLHSYPGVMSPAAALLQSPSAAAAAASVAGVNIPQTPSPSQRLLQHPSQAPDIFRDHRRGSIAPFLRSLHDILSKEDDTIIRWTKDGKAFEIVDMNGLTSTILPKYFKHNRYPSFQRQLNYFGFRKWTKSQAAMCTFSNEFFTREKPGDIRFIKRKNKAERSRKSNSTSSHIPHPFHHHHQQQQHHHPHHPSMVSSPHFKRYEMNYEQLKHSGMNPSPYQFEPNTSYSTQNGWTSTNKTGSSNPSQSDAYGNNSGNMSSLLSAINPSPRDEMNPTSYNQTPYTMEFHRGNESGYDTTSLGFSTSTTTPSNHQQTSSSETSHLFNTPNSQSSNSQVPSFGHDSTKLHLQKMNIQQLDNDMFGSTDLQKENPIYTPGY